MSATLAALAPIINFAFVIIYPAVLSAVVAVTALTIVAAMSDRR